MKKLRIVFMGTPEFAVGILKEILENQYEVVGVITAPDKPAGRGQKVKESAVKSFAVQHSLNVLQPINLKDEEFLSELKSLNANLHVVVAFRMLPEAVWKMPEFGTFNLHASLLPEYRGAAPINWAIINGDSKTGVTTFFIDDKIDTGAIIASAETTITDDETAGQLHDKLMDLGSKLVVETLSKIENGTATTTLQTDAPALKPAPKLTKENSRIDWSRSGKAIYNQIRGLSPYPAAWTDFVDGDKEWNVKIYEAKFRQQQHDLPIGKIAATKKSLEVAVADGFITIDSLQFPGKKKMQTAELLNGMSFSDQAIAR